MSKSKEFKKMMKEAIQRDFENTAKSKIEMGISDYQTKKYLYQKKVKQTKENFKMLELKLNKLYNTQLND